MISKAEYYNERTQLVQLVADYALNKKVSLACIESCTGGELAVALTSQPGSSRWFQFGIVTYSNEAKKRFANVDSGMLKDYGAVSEPVVCRMAQSAIGVDGVGCSMAISGIAGPGGDGTRKPVGSVWMACAWMQKSTISKSYLFKGNRTQIIQQSVLAALEMALFAFSCR